MTTIASYERVLVAADPLDTTWGAFVATRIAARDAVRAIALPTPITDPHQRGLVASILAALLLDDERWQDMSIDHRRRVHARTIDAGLTLLMDHHAPLLAEIGVEL